MEEEKLQARDEKPLSNGEWLTKTLKPLGCVIVLVCMVLMVALCLSLGRDPIKGYEPPETQEYYSQNLSGLQTELEENVLPLLDGNGSCETENGFVVVTIDSGSFVKTRAAVLKYFNKAPLDFRER